MKLFCTFLLVVALSCGASAQNLVLNGGFDQMLGCPTALSMIASSEFWMNPSNGTPDYFHQCASPFFAGVPINQLGFQFPHSGEAYGGIHRWQDGLINFREYLEGTLSAPLVAGTCYHFEMFISLANFSKFNAPDIGVLFSDTLMSGMLNTQMLTFTPQISNPSTNLPDTATWLPVTGNFTATGGENFIIIGNFNDDATIDTSLYNAFALWPITYVYIDDVSLTPCTGNQEITSAPLVRVYPNPVASQLHVASRTANPADFILYDLAMRTINRFQFTGSASLDFSGYQPGVYFYSIRFENGEVVNGRLLKQ
ncbi:MAG TPA: T9SS type A sorting domain-containing protein [Bacteroidia bacterium]|nr:T9SS type A sorting domain-containing protein [Bacteroidia bacterium]